jgi:hypothetical protein
MKNTFIIQCQGHSEIEIFECLLTAAVAVGQKRLRTGGATMKHDESVKFFVATIDPLKRMTAAEALTTYSLIDDLAKDVARPVQADPIDEMSLKQMEDDIERDIELKSAHKPVSEIASFTEMQALLNKIRNH